MFKHGLGVLFLARGFGLDGPTLHINVDLPLDALTKSADGGADGRADILDAQPILPAQFPLHLIDNRGRLPHLLAVAGQMKLIIPADHGHAKGFAEHFQMPIRRAKEGEFLVGLFEGNIQIHGC